MRANQTLSSLPQQTRN